MSYSPSKEQYEFRLATLERHWYEADASSLFDNEWMLDDSTSDQEVSVLIDCSSNCQLLISYARLTTWRSFDVLDVTGTKIYGYETIPASAHHNRIGIRISKSLTL